MSFQTEQEKAWEIGGEIIAQGVNHPSLACITESWQGVLVKLLEVQEFSAQLKRHGVGRTEDPTLILARLVPKLEEHAETITAVVSQMRERLARG